MDKRQSISKGTRFELFRRDSFICQYCGRQPPEVVLEIDHIIPVIDGGANDPMNLITACRDCNRAKGRKRLDEIPQRPDADLAWLEMQQEIAELKAYQEAKQQRDALLDQIVEQLQDTWQDLTGYDWAPTDKVLKQMLSRFSPQSVEQAIKIVAPKQAAGTLRGQNGWLPYMWGTLKKLSAIEESEHE